MGETVKKIFTGTAYNLLGRITSTLFGFLSTLFIIRNYSVSDYGTYTLVMSLVSLASIATSFGLPGMLERYSPEFYARKDLNSLRKLLFAAVLLRLFLSVLFILLLFNSTYIQALLQFTIFKDFRIEIGILLIAVLQVQLLGDVFLVALLQQKFYNLAYSAYSAFIFMGIYSSVQFNWGLTGVFSAIALGNLILALVFLFKSFLLVHSNQQTVRASFPLKRLIRYGFFVFFVGLGYSFVDVWIDNFVINYYLGKEHVAYYGFANTIAHMLTIFSPALLILPLLTSTSISLFTKTRSLNDLAFAYKLYTKIITFFALPAFIGFIVLADKIILAFFGEKYLSTIHLVTIVLVFSFLRLYTHPLKIMIKTLEKMHLLLLSFFLSAYNLAMDIILIKSYGVTGVAVATGTTTLLSYLLMKTIVSKEIQCTFPFRSTLKVILCTTLMTLPVLLLRQHISGMLSLMLVIALGIATYVVSAAVIKPFEMHERELFNKSIGKKLWVF